MLVRIEEGRFQYCSLQSVCIPRLVAVLNQRSFVYSDITTLTFQKESQLIRIQVRCFFRCRLQSFCLPRSVEVVGRHVFAACENLVMLTFEAGSRLARSGELCCKCCFLLKSILLPASTVAIGPWAFDRQTRVTVLPQSNPLRGIVRSIFDGSLEDDVVRVSSRLLTALLL
jgi:hypothetical protein